MNRTATGSKAVVQVAGARRPASGVVHGPDTIVTTARAAGWEDGLRVRLPDNRDLEADLVGWDPSTGIAAIRTRTPHGLETPTLAPEEARTGEFVLAIGRSWTNIVTASSGTIAIIGGPLRTGRRRQIERVIRVTAPMHEGFAGGAVFDARGHLSGIATGGEIRGFGVVIPSSIAWASATRVLTSGTPQRGFIGIAVQAVDLPSAQRPEGRQKALLVLGVTPSSPAESAGVNVGDILLDVDGRSTESPDDLLDLLWGHRAGQVVSARILRGGAIKDLELTVAERT